MCGICNCDFENKIRGAVSDYCGAVFIYAFEEPLFRPEMVGS